MSLINLFLSAGAEDSWSFLVMADWHGAEFFANAPGPNSQLYKDIVTTISNIHETYGGDLIILPGDTQSGNWNTNEWRNKFYPNLSIQEAVYKAGMNCWTTMKSLFADAGYDKILVAVGDHEIGDNYWAPNDSKTLSLPQFRESFKRALYFDNNTPGNHIYANKAIGDAPATPYGTEFEFTSFAHRHKNALFITIDSFYRITSNSLFFDRREGGLGGEGVITGDVTGSHLQWFENVLKEARKDPSIKHIFVQSHLPVLNPVRKVLSSAMFFDRGERSNFWKVMVKYGVDIYFAGEVHANTVLKDEYSNTLQIVSRANTLDNFLQVVVQNDSLIVNSLYETGKARTTLKSFKKYGSLVLNKTSKDTTISSSGSLRLVNVGNPIMHFSFEQLYMLGERRVLGLRSRRKLRAWQVDMQGTTLKHAIANGGEFAEQYDAQVGGIALKKGGISGKAALFKGETSNMGIYSVGPLVAGNVVSYSIWFRTEQAGEMILIHFGPSWNSAVYKEKNIFTLTLDGGNPKLYASTSSILKPSQRNGLHLNDNGWHQVAVSMPNTGCNLSQVKMFVDGKPISTSTTKDVTLFFVNHGRLSIGGLGYSSTSKSDFPSWKAFTGYIDEVYIWARTIWQNDLRESPKRVFNNEQMNTCKVKHSRGLKKIYYPRLRKKNQCRNRCNQLTPCLGFEAVQTAESPGFVNCTLYLNKRPKFITDENIVHNDALCSTIM